MTPIQKANAVPITFPEGPGLLIQQENLEASQKRLGSVPEGSRSEVEKSESEFIGAGF